MIEELSGGYGNPMSIPFRRVSASQKKIKWGRNSDSIKQGETSKRKSEPLEVDSTDIIVVADVMLHF